MNIKPNSGNTITPSERSAVFEAPAMVNHSILMIESRLAALESDIERINNVLNTAFDRIDALDDSLKSLCDDINDMKQRNTSLGDRVLAYFQASPATSLRSSDIKRTFGIATTSQTNYVMRSAKLKSHGAVDMIVVRSQRGGREAMLIKIKRNEEMP